jgi:hypothetical protein
MMRLGFKPSLHNSGKKVVQAVVWSSFGRPAGAMHLYAKRGERFLGCTLEAAFHMHNINNRLQIM